MESEFQAQRKLLYEAFYVSMARMTFKETQNAGDELLRGKSDYRQLKLRPDPGTEDAVNLRYLGWMIARSDDIDDIIEKLRAKELDNKTFEIIFKMAIIALDTKHGLDQGRKRP